MEIIRVSNLTKKFTIYEKEAGLKGVFKSFFNAKKIIKTAVDDVSFSINEGEILGYIGPNGAGKSTTIKVLTGILTPTSGEVVVDGLIPYQKRTQNAKKIGVVFGQRTQLWWDLPLNESFTVLKEIYQVSDEDFKDDVDWFGLFYTMRTYFRTENLDYEKELYQKYYEDIFKMDESRDRPDRTSGFWKAITLGVELPMDYIKESIMDRKTAFAIDKDNLFYPQLHRFWETEEFDIYIPEEIKNEGKQNIINFMNRIKNDKELYLFIKLQ